MNGIVIRVVFVIMLDLGHEGKYEGVEQADCE